MKTLHKLTYTDFRTLSIFIIFSLLLSGGTIFPAKSQIKPAKSLELLIMNDNKMRPIVTHKDFFWGSKNLDTITFSGDLYYDLVSFKISKLKQDSVSNNFTIASAFIFREKQKIDTVYSDIFLRYWMIGCKTYTGGDEFLSRMFRPLYLGHYTDMRKGEF